MKMKVPALVLVLASLVGCGGVVNSECSDAGSTSEAVQVTVASAYAGGEVVILGSCQDFKCARASGTGCTLWQGTISTEGDSSCRITLTYRGETIESTIVSGTDACSTGTQKITLGDAPMIR